MSQVLFEGPTRARRQKRDETPQEGQFQEEKPGDRKLTSSVGGGG